MKSLIVFVDMDDTIADFLGSERLHSVSIEPVHNSAPKEMLEVGFFRELSPIPGALEALRILHQLHCIELYILTKPVHYSSTSYSEKVEWIRWHLPELSDRIIMTQRKELCVGHYLIDDNLDWKGPWENASGGTFIHFDPRAKKAEQWAQILKFFITLSSNYSE